MPTDPVTRREFERIRADIADLAAEHKELRSDHMGLKTTALDAIHDRDLRRQEVNGMFREIRERQEQVHVQLTDQSKCLQEMAQAYRTAQGFARVGKWTLATIASAGAAIAILSGWADEIGRLFGPPPK